MKNAILLSALFATASSAAAPDNVAFSHGDWQIACDNTRTCRAAGYHAELDGEEPPQAVSVLLVRKAGPGEPIAARLQIGTYVDEPVLRTLPRKVTMRIGRRALGMVALDKAFNGELSRQQTEALVAALAGNSSLSWSGAGKTWTVSGKGGAAVLLKMDEFQGRLGTPGAALRKGSKPEDGVLPSLTPPVVKAAPLPKAEARPADKAIRAQLLASLRPFEAEECPRLKEVAEGRENLLVTPLSDGKQLVSAPCWMGAYNTGDGYWVTNLKPPYAPVLVTSEATDVRDGTIMSARKGRGLGDCWVSETWVWDGRRFVNTASTSTGMCRLVAPGGAWDLPSVVSEVRR